MDYNDDASFSWLGNIKNPLVSDMKKLNNSLTDLKNSFYKKFELSKRALVLGAGISGQACTRWLEENHKIVTIVDSRELKSKKIAGSDTTIITGIKFPLSDSWFDQVDFVVVSPGLSPYLEKKSGLAQMLKTTNKRKIPVVTELDLFDLANNDYLSDSNENSTSIPIIAVTGTNGKTSVVKLVTKLFNALEIDAQEAGNIRPSLLEAFLKRKILNKMPDIWVLELSSFQLALSNQFSPTFSTILNLSNDHLDWHLSIEEYLSSKLKVFGIPKPTAKAFICRDDIELLKKINMHFEVHRKNFANLTFGSDFPKLDQSFGINNFGKFCFKDSQARKNLYEFPLNTKELNLKGRHNYSNITCCLAIVTQLSKNYPQMAKVLKSHVGEPHRLENFLTCGNINYIDDSKATNVAATISAIKSLEEPLILILGGLTKGQNFNSLTEILHLRSINLIVFGLYVSTICESFKNSSLLFEKAKDLKEAVFLANKIANEKITLPQKNPSQINILLSPACSSLDVYENYRQRGEDFKKLVITNFHGERIC